MGHDNCSRALTLLNVGTYNPSLSSSFNNCEVQLQVLRNVGKNTSSGINISCFWYYSYFFFFLIYEFVNKERYVSLTWFSALTFLTVYEDQTTLLLLLYVSNIQELFHEHALDIIISYPIRESTMIALLELYCCCYFIYYKSNRGEVFPDVDQVTYII